VKTAETVRGRLENRRPRTPVDTIENFADCRHPEIC